MTRTGLAGLLVASASISACSKGHTETSPPPAAAQSAAGVTRAAPAPNEAPNAAGGSSDWHGAYASVAGTLHVPAQWKNVHWTGADVDAGLGGGTMSLTVDSASGRVRGAIEGPLGPATIDGYTAKGNLTASVFRKDPSDHGFEGTLEGVLTDAGADGTMSVSLAEASAIRTATFKLAPGAGGSTFPR